MKMMDSPLGKQEVSVFTLLQRVGGSDYISNGLLDPKAEVRLNAFTGDKLGFDSCQCCAMLRHLRTPAHLGRAMDLPTTWLHKAAPPDAVVDHQMHKALAVQVPRLHGHLSRDPI